LPVAKKAASFAALGGLVFSTDAGRHCPDCSKPVDACICKQVIPEGDGIARVRRESKGRGGKTVTTITGVPLAEDARSWPRVEETLRHRWGVEGRGHRDPGRPCRAVLGELTKHGFKAKKVSAAEACHGILPKAFKACSVRAVCLRARTNRHFQL
jgi:translation initiation factor 1